MSRNTKKTKLPGGGGGKRPLKSTPLPLAGRSMNNEPFFGVDRSLPTRAEIAARKATWAAEYAAWWRSLPWWRRAWLRLSGTAAEKGPREPIYLMTREDAETMNPGGEFRGLKAWLDRP